MNEISSLDQVCRTCLKTCYPGLDLLQDPKLVELYVRLSSTKLDSKDPLPKKICSLCYKRLEEIRNFQTTCIESYNSLLRQLNIKDIDIKDEKSEIFIKEEQIEMGFDEEIEEQLVQIEITKDASNDGSDYDPLEEEDGSAVSENASESTSGDDTDEEQVDSDEDEKPLVKSPVKRNRRSKKEIALSKVEGDKSDAANETEPGMRGKLYYCDKCPRMFMKRWTYEGHLRVHMGLKAYECPLCPKTFNHFTQLKSHKRINHSDNPVRLPCPIEGCTADFKTRGTLMKHVKTQHISPPTPEEKANRPRFVCEQCGKVLSTKGCLNKHSLSHERTYPCELCTLKFPTRIEILRHMRVSHPKIKKHACQYCDQRFVRMETLKSHVMRHTGERKYECPFCDKRFIQSTPFRMHVMRHNKANETKAKASTTHENSD